MSRHSERVIPLKRLKKRTGVTDDQLDKEVNNDSLVSLAQHIVDYRKYAPRLGLSDSDIKDIENNPLLFYSLRQKSEAVFKEWHKKKLGSATYRRLVDVALQLEDGIAAERICEACVKRFEAEGEQEEDDVESSPEPQPKQKKARKGVLTLDEAIKKTGVTGEQLDHPCDDEVILDEIAEHIVKYRHYGSRLHLSSADITAIESNPRLAGDIKLITAQVFKSWYRKDPYGATYRVLAEVAIQLKDGAGAKKICEICAEEVEVEEDMDSSPEPQPKRPAPKRKDKSKKTSKRSAKKVPSDEEENPISDEDLDYERDLQPAPKVEETKQARGRGRGRPRGGATDLKKPGNTPQQPKDGNDQDSDQPDTTDGKQKDLDFCGGDNEEVPQSQGGNGTQDNDIAHGSVRLTLRWDKTRFQELKIHFLNPKTLEKEKWLCGRKVLTTDLILAWATYWNSHATHYPRLADMEATKEDAQIRVFFDKTTGSRSRVGNAALKVTDPKEPTMILNLYGMSQPQQRSMVLHEFGHTLGLDHEHQRSDFWDVLESRDEDDDLRFIIGKNKMKSGNKRKCRVACDAVFRAPWVTPTLSEQTPYDPKSIMHYWFDINWLKTEYRNLGDIRRMPATELTETERKVLEGVHARDYHNGQLALNPSPLDFKALNDAYSSTA